MSKKAYKIFIEPSSDEERLYWDCENFDECVEVFRKNNTDVEETPYFEFTTKRERDAFIEGYEAAIGYLGGGFYATKDE
jgi:hypothetical protein